MINHCRTLSVVIPFVLLTLAASGAGSGANDAWPQFRGPNCSGVAPGAKPPVQVGPDTGVAWKADVPWSPSSPCVWGDRIFLTTFDQKTLQTRSYDRATGALLWTKSIEPEALEIYHRAEGSPAASTPATDGTHVVVYFGSVGLVCYDFDGREVWRFPLPVAQTAADFGSGSSPIIRGDRVILNRDQQVDAMLLALDLRSGKVLWKTPRLDGYGGYGTPIIWNNSGTEQVVVPGSARLRGYDLRSGAESWMIDGVSVLICTTPVADDKRLYFAAWCYGASDSPWPSWEQFYPQHDKNKDGEIAMEELEGQALDYYRGLDGDHDGKLTAEDWRNVIALAAKGENMAIAVEPGGRGDITKTHVAWKFTKGLPYVPSPVLYDGRLYFVKDGGMLSCVDPATGKPHYTQERIGASGKYYASPVAADGRIYLASLKGELTVVKAGGDQPEVLHQADFDERIAGTPALVGTRIYLRTASKLYALE